MSGFGTTRQPDDPVSLDANYRMDRADRRTIDAQILVVEQYLADALLNGTIATYYTLDSGSAALVAGVCFCSSSNGSGTVTKADAAALARAGAVLGVALASAAVGSSLLGAVSGSVAPAITGLAAVAGFARVDTATARIEKVASFVGGDYPVGAIDSAGLVTLGGAAATITNSSTITIVDMNNANVAAAAFGNPMPAATLLRSRGLTATRSVTLPSATVLGSTAHILYVTTNGAGSGVYETQNTADVTTTIDGGPNMAVGGAGKTQASRTFLYDGISDWKLIFLWDGN